MMLLSASSAPTKTLVVQQSFPDPRPTTNPYIVMLRDALRAVPGLEVRTFSWGRAILGRYDVFHAHWPEILLQGSTPAKTLAREVLFAALVVRLAVGGVPIVRTQHNVHLPTGLSWLQGLLLRSFDKRTAVRVALNEETAAAVGSDALVIPHGHYRDWFGGYARSTRRHDAYGYFGLVRRYKNVEALVEAFSALPGDVRLQVAGKPSSTDLAASLERLAAADPRVELSLGFLTDAELVAVATSCSLVVLPYTHMHNSGSVLASLSLATPVLVPANSTNAALAEEVGPGWVLQFEGDLKPADLSRALAQAQEVDRSTEPDLSRRGWEGAGVAHLEAYRTALMGAKRPDRVARLRQPLRISGDV
jgi:beta-1,4-mannosyltransferase